jgi:hypothetical protein
MALPISPFFKRETEAEKAATAAYRAETEGMRVPNQRPASALGGVRLGASIETPAAEVLYLPESREKGRLGEIMRASPKELEAIYEKMPETERPVEAIRGTESTYWSPGTRQEYGDLRTAMTGFKQPPAEATAAGRLSAAIQGQARTQMFEDYDIKTTAMFSPHITRGPEGEEMIPDWARELYSAGKAMSLEDPEGAIRYVEKEIAKREQTQGRLDRLNAMSDEELATYEQSLMGEPEKVAPSAAVTPTPLSAVTPKKKPGEAAARLRAEYEKEYPTPRIGAETLGRVGEAWKARRESPYVRLGG